uniref:Uncharacterized protein n=1 Tax=Hyaloperonospora arabidopsidis (strain Emoy2) TaxID=559515 RepID=M4BV17_HYAAE
MLQRTSCLVRHIIDQDEAQCALNRRIYSENVLDEIVYDVESCEYACELERLIRKVSMAERSLVEYRERENDLIQERQQAYEHAVKIEQEGRMIWTKVNQHMSVVQSELAMKEVYVEV